MTDQLPWWDPLADIPQGPVGSLPPVDPELNRRVISERLHWPVGALEETYTIEEEFPRWRAFWANGVPTQPQRGFRAITHRDYRSTAGAHPAPRQAYGATADELRAALAEADRQLPSPD